MIIEPLRRYIADELGFEDTVVFDNPSYDRSIIGITGDGRLIYDFDSMVEELKYDEEIYDEIQAIDFIGYNTVRSLPYIDEKVRPIIMYKLEY